MARLFLLLLIIGISIVPSFQSERYGDDPELLHVSKEKSSASPIRIPAEMFGEYVTGSAMRRKRDVKMTSSDAGGTKDSTTPSNPSTIPLKKPQTTNERSNLTVITSNNITTMVNKSTICFYAIFFCLQKFSCSKYFLFCLLKY